MATPSMAAADLGLGDQLSQQVQDELRRRKQQKDGNIALPPQTVLGTPAVQALFPGGPGG